MLDGLVIAVEGDAVLQLVAPRLRQRVDVDVRALDLVRQRQAEHVGVHALVHGHHAVCVADEVFRLAPAVGAESAARGKRERGDHDEDCDQTIAAAALARLLALRLSLVMDGLGDVGIVGIVGDMAVTLLDDRYLAGVGVGAFAVLLAHGRRLRDARRRLRGGLALYQRGGALRWRCVRVAQHGRGGDRLVEDVCDGLQAGARRSGDQWGLVGQVEGIRVESQRGVGDDRGHVVGAAGLQGHRNQLLGAFLLIGVGGERLLDGGILQHAAQAVGAQHPTVGWMGGPNGDVGVRIDVEVAEHAHDDVALRMVARLRGADAACVDEMLNVAVVLRHAGQATVAQQVRARVADVREHPVARDQRHGGHRGAHAGELALALRLADDRVVRGHDGRFHHPGDGAHVAVDVIVLDVGE